MRAEGVIRKLYAYFVVSGNNVYSFHRIFPQSPVSIDFGFFLQPTTFRLAYVAFISSSWSSDKDCGLPTITAW